MTLGPAAPHLGFSRLDTWQLSLRGYSPENSLPLLRSACASTSLCGIHTSELEDQCRTHQDEAVNRQERTPSPTALRSTLRKVTVGNTFAIQRAGVLLSRSVECLAHHSVLHAAQHQDCPRLGARASSLSHCALLTLLNFYLLQLQ